MTSFEPTCSRGKPLFGCVFKTEHSRVPRLPLKSETPREAGSTGNSWCLSAKTELLDERTVALDVDSLEVSKEATAATHHEQEATTRVVVVLVLL